jgi:hypothetical protein
MAYHVRTRDEHFLNDGSPKHILALDGGGLRGILTLSYLAAVESLLRERHGGADTFRLSHYFDLIAGTSTGAIIAAALAQGMKVGEISKKYLALGQSVFKKGLFDFGIVRAQYDDKKLSEELNQVYGANSTMGDSSLQTGLLVVTKRLDSASTWPISNNPRGRYFNAGPSGDSIANSAYPLWQVVRASTAAPSYFEPETIEIARGRSGEKPIAGEFVDGGMSPFNNPALQALMFSTLDGYRIGWPTGANNLLLVSVGTGSRDPSIAHAMLAAKHALNAMLSLMDDCAALMEILLQWMSTSQTARVIDRELGDLRHDSIAPAPLISYLRYNVALTKDPLTQVGMSLADEKIASLSAMDDPDNMQTLQEVGARAAKQQVRPEDFPANFDLTG